MHHLVLSVEEGLHFSTVPPILGIPLWFWLEICYRHQASSFAFDISLPSLENSLFEDPWPVFS